MGQPIDKYRIVSKRVRNVAGILLLRTRNIRNRLARRPNDGWIPVEEGFPEETGYYLAQLSRKLPNEDYSDRVVVLFNGEEKEFMCYANLIIAWHTLPEWYKPDEKSKETN